MTSWDSQGKENEYFRPDAGMLFVRVVTERLECRQDDEDGGPAMVEREREVDEELVGSGLRRVMLLDDVVNVLGANASVVATPVKV